MPKETVLSFENLEYSIATDEKFAFCRRLSTVLKKQKYPKPKILKSIMGPSGAGKTSLLNCIAGITQEGEISGTIKVNGKQVPQKVLRAMSGFVHQDDVFDEKMTVCEVLKMAMYLRYPKVDEKEAADIIGDTLIRLGLSHVRNTIIGSSMMKGISGGERKRVAIGMELISQSPVLFLDECTSGLDSFTALSILKLLKTVAQSGITVILTLHQPSYEIFEMIDELIILVQGSVLYNGAAADMMGYFSKFDYVCPVYHNPPDYIFSQVINNSNEEKISAIVSKSKEQCMKAFFEMEKIISRSQKYLYLKHYPSVYQQFRYLFPRILKNKLRARHVLLAQTGNAIGVSLLAGALYFNVEGKGTVQQVLQNITGAFYFASSNMFLSSAMEIMATVSKDRDVFYRNYQSGYYGVFAFFVTNSAVEIPFQCFFALLYASILYLMMGFGAGQFLIFACALILAKITGVSYGKFIGYTIEDERAALIVLSAIVLPMLLMGGLLVNVDTAPKWLYWIKLYVKN